MASIAFQQVTKTYDRHTVAVSDLTLEVPDGQFLVLVGPSGCGKTTTLRLVAGLETPTSGAIHIGAKPVADVSPRDRNVAMVFQDGALYPHMDVYANMAFALRMKRLSATEARRRVVAAAEMLGIASLLHRKSAALSGGERRRVALGRAMVREPAAFLLDEPLSSLDPLLQGALRTELKALHQRLATTTLYVTHDQAEAMALGQRIGVLHHGRLQQVGSPDDIYRRPANRFVAGFFGMPPMNFLTARVRRQHEGLSLEIAGAGFDLPAPLRSSLAGHVGPTVLAGIRPHDLSLKPRTGPGGDALSGKVTHIEPLGSRCDVHVQLHSGEKCVVCTAPDSVPRVGADVSLHIDPDRLHLFEPDGTCRNIRDVAV
ncbi:MAG: ABC transporter ATP-binding protein [Sedimentisphaerales bacterium]|nr:ABC transporter ATP-binding protein [Sedimentisphaerales bacterium]